MGIQTTQAIVSKKESDVEFVPFGSDEKIKLSLNIIRNYVAEPGKGGELPDERQSMKFLMLCKSRKLNPFEGDAFMIPFWSSSKNRYDWSLITAQAAFLKRAEVNQEYDGKESGIIISPALQCNPCSGSGAIEKAGERVICPHCKGRGEVDELPGDFIPETIGGEKITLVGGWCKVYYKTRSKPEYQRLRLSTYAKNTPQWKDDPAGMICKCAEAAALRSAFPTTLGGLYLQEELQARIAEDASIKKPVFSQNNPQPEPKPKEEEPEVVDVTPEPEAEPETPEQAEQKQPPAEPQSVSPVKRIRDLCKESKIKETKLIDFLIETGSAEPGTASLEQIMLEYPNVIDAIIKGWEKILTQLKK